MPEVFRFFGFSFFFYSKEHEPLHIHVEGNGGMAKFEWNGSEFVLAEKQGIKSNDFRKIKTVIDENADIIIKREIWFDAEHIYGRDEEGNEYSQSLLWYPKLRMATDEERAAYTFGFDGIHWRELDEDISFESFAYDDAEPTSLQRFFLTHKEINIAEFARSLGINATLLRNYINGFKKPSAEREKAIIDHIHKLGREMIAACF